MGYVARTVSNASVKKALIEGSVYHFANYVIDATTAWFDHYKQTLDLTDVDYLLFTYHKEASSDIRLTIGGNVQFTDTGAANWYKRLVDCTAMTGELEILLELKNDSGVDEYVNDFMFRTV